MGKAAEILAVFTKQVAASGYDGANFGEIAGRLGISKGTIVHHYGTKDRLLAALHESYLRRRLREAELIMASLDTPAQRLAGLLFAFILYQEHDRDATIAFQREVVRLAREESGVQLRAEYVDLVRGVISDGVASGQFRPVDVPVQSLLMFGSAQWAYAWYDPAGRRSVDEVGAALVDLVLGSLLTRRSAVARLADPGGPVLRTVRRCLAAA
ncbi:TetR/AcrR family transcriptional regulator [Amycolatopsis acidicola]|uniref:TetR/AcrR family transcriptional regulator n=1 Tax=Amycolatopsis acidicola TaxID=2596893 RepID=A0A5N0UPN8_9PSEU|nr:TetR/AcrR family transcriptional regulator [Amycolatopsis acidicola]KAA9150716.1 TetR/AcrR family transcriptional regulator [Amycolatopsis acidicola]